ncbi:MAG TPA: hypothetical protein VF432_04915, partial [Thermoanaerobaculia bacterium]
MIPSIDRREKIGSIAGFFVSIGDFCVSIGDVVADVDGGRHQISRPRRCDRWSPPSIEPEAAPRSMTRVIDRGRQCREIDEGLHRSYRAGSHADGRASARSMTAFIDHAGGRANVSGRRARRCAERRLPSRPLRR